MTDLNAESELLPLQPVREEWKGHKVAQLNMSLILLRRRRILLIIMGHGGQRGVGNCIREDLGEIFCDCWISGYGTKNVYCRAWCRLRSTSMVNSFKRTCWRRLSTGERIGCVDDTDANDHCNDDATDADADVDHTDADQSI